VDKSDQIQAVEYARVSTSEQAISGLGLAAQEGTIRSECVRRGWQLVDVVLDAGESGKNLDRPGLRHALELVANRGATVLVAAKLDRISRSVLDFVALLEWFSAADASLVALDVGVDTSTPGGAAGGQRVRLGRRVGAGHDFGANPGCPTSSTRPGSSGEPPGGR
jgi:DNA invertase Pin-like site-specific DNA recombinase